MKFRFASVSAAIGVLLWHGVAMAQQPASFRNSSAFDQVIWLARTQPDARLRYGTDSAVQFGDLRLPKTPPPAGGHPVVLFVHGGGWTSDYTKDYSNRFVEDLTNAGFATWDIEFRRLGNKGGGYPGMFLDVGMGADHLRKLAATYPLDLDRVVAMGHSSGGHLALWLAGRKNLPKDSKLYAANPLPLAGVISLAGVNDLQVSLDLGKRTDGLEISGVATATEAGPRFKETSPGQLLPFGIPQVLMVGTKDNDWRVEMTKIYAKAAQAAGDTVSLSIPNGANHFDVVDSEGPLFQEIVAAARKIVKPDLQ